MADAVASLAALLEPLQRRVAELESRAGVAAPAAGGAGAAPKKAAAFDDEPTATTREWDALIVKFGEPLAKVAATIGGDATALVRYAARTTHAARRAHARHTPRTCTHAPPPPRAGRSVPGAVQRQPAHAGHCIQVQEA